ncbi:hypothetical protein [Arenimonas metalli]|uniref:Uncharacterized protein n=1 Tax=Arenimonas metalli CF5-1 TaxID=1384056 RepID=A0A091B1S8_9GAMM|nr:hypothetical protein [Arenimonas metalli]KFN46548.1 hypothetical protein N787_09980 [Arenimonas metalli CF5-1]
MHVRPGNPRWLLAAGGVMVLGAVAHLLAPLGGPAWYQALGAPPGLAVMAAAGSMRPAITCVVIATLLLACAAFAFSGAGRRRPLPLLRPALAAIGVGLLVRGLAFIPLAAWRPQLLSGLCGRCEGANAFVWITSLLCLLLAAAYLHGAWALPRRAR